MISNEEMFRKMENRQNLCEPYLLSRWNNEKLILSQPKFTIGRGLNNSYVLEHLQVSRTHCILEKIEENWYVTDGSSNGTLLNKKKILPRTKNILLNGDVLKLTDKHEFVFVNIRRNSLDDIDLSAFIDEAAGMPINSNAQHRALDTNKVVDIPPKRNTILEIVSNANIEIPPKRNTLLEIVTDANIESNVTSNVVNEHTYCAIVQDDIAINTVPSIKSEISKTEYINEEVASTSSNTCMPTELNQNHSSGLHALQEAENELQCIICTELFIKATTLNCSHSFCKTCIEEWRKKNKKCPICRTKITTANPTIVLDNYIAKIIESSPDDVKENRREVVKSREQPENVKTAAATRYGRVLRSTVATAIEISSEEDNSYDDEDFIDDDYDNDYNGVPGNYYGGYGHCFSCGERGHWANGCPYR